MLLPALLASDETASTSGCCQCCSATLRRPPPPALPAAHIAAAGPAADTGKARRIVKCCCPRCSLARAPTAQGARARVSSTTRIIRRGETAELDVRHDPDLGIWQHASREVGHACAPQPVRECSAPWCHMPKACHMARRHSWRPRI
jgi:hypothetical protein